MKKTKKIKEKQETLEEKPVEELVETEAEKSKEEEKSPTFLTYSEMTDKQMEHYLFQLSGSIYYQAILRLNRLKDAEILNTLASNDPFKEPTLLARNQGERIGLFNLENKVEKLIKKNKEVNMSKEEKAKIEAETPSYGNW